MLNPLQTLNSAFAPKWQQPQGYQPTVQVPEATLDQTNPIWARALDALGASNPGGIKMNPGTLGAQQALQPQTMNPVSQAPLQALKAAQPADPRRKPGFTYGSPQVQAPAPLTSIARNG